MTALSGMALRSLPKLAIMDCADKLNQGPRLSAMRKKLWL